MASTYYSPYPIKNTQWRCAQPRQLVQAKHQEVSVSVGTARPTSCDLVPQTIYESLFSSVEALELVAPGRPKSRVAIFLINLILGHSTQLGQRASNFKSLLQEFVRIATKWTQNDYFGLTLVHRHTDVGPGMRMLDFKQNLQPLPLPDDVQYLHGCPIRPKSYTLVDNIWKPYECEMH